MPNKVLGIDPGLNRSGLAVLDEQHQFLLIKTVKIPVRLDLKGRLDYLSRAIEEVVAEHQPSVCIIERPGNWSTRLVAVQRPETLLHLGMAIGVALAACGNVPTQVPTVDVIRRSIMGQAKAPKEAVQWYLERRKYELPLLKSGRVDPDAADAMLIALYGLEEILGVEMGRDTKGVGYFAATKKPRKPRRNAGSSYKPGRGKKGRKKTS